MLQTEEINQIRSSVDIVDVISGYLPLTQKGKNFFGVCPFHDDHSPSMSVSREKQIYTCFSCGATGNVFKFLMDYENISFPEAVQKVADRAGIAVDLHIKSHHVKTALRHLRICFKVLSESFEYGKWTGSQRVFTREKYQR